MICDDALAGREVGGMGYGVEYQYKPDGQWYTRRFLGGLSREEALDVLLSLQTRGDLHAIRVVDKSDRDVTEQLLKEE